MVLPQNPYSPPTATGRPSPWTDLAELKASGFVFRKLQIHWPVEAGLVYSGWNFLQRVWVDDVLVWRRISWIRFYPYISFRLPRQVDPQQRDCALQLAFYPGLRIQRCELSIAGRTIYEEQN